MSDNFKPFNRGTHSSKAVHPGLPDPGYARREELKRRDDTLAQEAEEQAAKTGIGTIDPEALTLESELVSQMDELHVTNAQPGYRYCWVNYDAPSSARGLMVKRKLAQRGWEIVCGDMPEAIEVKDVTGNRRIGDVILMRITEQRFQQLQAQEDAIARRMENSSHSTLQELGEKYRNRGVVIHVPETMNPALLKRMEAHARGAVAAQQKLDQSLRDGTIEGV